MGDSNPFSQGHALVIGVGADLPMTVRDAEAVHGLLVDPTRGAYPPAQATLLTRPGAAALSDLVRSRIHGAAPASSTLREP